MAISEVSTNKRFSTSTTQVTLAGLVFLACAFVLYFVISTSMIQELFGYSRQIHARVPTFFIRTALLLTAFVAALYFITGFSFYKRNKIEWAPWLFLALGLGLFMIYVIVPIFQSISYSFAKWDGLYDINGVWTGEWVGFHNYKVLLDDPNFYTSLKNNLLWLLLYMR